MDRTLVSRHHTSFGSIRHGDCLRFKSKSPGQAFRHPPAPQFQFLTLRAVEGSPVSIQAPVGPNRTVTVTAFNAASPPLKIFGGTLPGVNLTQRQSISRSRSCGFSRFPFQKEGDGSGTVTSSPVGIDCGSACSGQFQEGVTVSLNAAAAPGSAFAGWGGDCSGTGACTVNGNATVIRSLRCCHCHQPIKCGQDRKRFRDGNEQS